MMHQISYQQISQKAKIVAFVISAVNGIAEVALLLAVLLSAQAAVCQDADTKAQTSPPVCKDLPFAYDNGPAGQPSWCDYCNKASKDNLQAPINITNTKPNSSLPAIVFKYKDAQLENIKNANNLKVKGAGSITIPGLGDFDLQEFHFHRPSEEAINNHRSAMVIHLVHEDKKHQHIVVSVLVEEGRGFPPAAKELVATLIRNFPPPLTPQTVRPAIINAGALLPPGNRDYYRFIGSLTTPPCDTGVIFFVLKTPIYLQPDQISEFAKRYPSPNARNIQESFDREIVEKVTR